MYNTRARLLIFVVSTAFSLCSAPGFAQGKHGAGANHAAAPSKKQTAPKAATPIDQFQRMTPEQRQQALKGLSKDERQKLQQRLQDFNNLPPEQQRNLRNMYNRLQQLPPNRQEAVRKAVTKLSQQPPERQQALRDELKGMAALPEDQRQARLESPDFKKKYSHKEQDIIRDMSDLLPPQ